MQRLLQQGMCSALIRSQADFVQQGSRLLYATNSVTQQRPSPVIDRQISAVWQRNRSLFGASQPSSALHASEQATVLSQDLAPSTGVPNSQRNSVWPAHSSTTHCSSQANFHAQSLLRGWSQLVTAPVIHRPVSMSRQAIRHLSAKLDRHASMSWQPARHMSTAAPLRRPDFAQLSSQT